MKKVESKIIDVAQELFSKLGFQKTTLTDIANSLGKRKTAIYYYFSGKEEIFEVIVKIQAKRFFQAIESEVNSCESVTQKIEKYIEKRILLMKEVAKQFNSFKSEIFYILPIIEEVREPYHEKEINLLKCIIEELEYDENESKLIAATIANTLKGLEIPMFVKDNVDTQEDTIRQLSNIILYGIIKQHKQE